MVGYKHAEMALLDQLKMKLKRTLRENILNIPAFPAFPALHQRRHYRKFNKSIKNKYLALILRISSFDTPNIKAGYKSYNPYWCRKSKKCKKYRKGYHCSVLNKLTKLEFNL